MHHHVSVDERNVASRRSCDTDIVRSGKAKILRILDDSNFREIRLDIADRIVI
jgi:hypothetical protein